MMLKKFPFLTLFVLSGATVSADPTVPADIYPILDQVYSWQAARIDPHNNQGVIGWKHATFYTGVMELYHDTNEAKYRDFLRGIASDNDWKLLRVNGDLWRHADNHLIGETYINLYLDAGRTTASEIADVTGIFDDMIASPWTGRRIYDWCDSLFMSPPVWAQLAALTGDDKYLEELDDLFWDSTDFLYNPTWQLYYRDQSYFGDTEPNGKPVFWSRGNGWVVGGLVRVLNYMPTDWPRRGQYVALFTDMAERLGAIQMDSGGWPSSLLYPEKYAFDTEVSGTSFFVYGLAWGINQGILDRVTYGPMVEKGWLEMNNNLNADGSISNIQTVGKEPQPNDNLVDKREYGYGAFILAGLEMAKYYSADSGEKWNGFPVIDHDGGRWANTGKFLGWLEVTNYPFVYLDTYRQWGYLNINESTPGGDWVYIFR